MQTIFQKSDFHLCHVPVPVGYPQSQTHVGVFPAGDGLLMTTSPFPNFKRPVWVEYLKAAFRKVSHGRYGIIVRGDYYENPCLYFSKDGISFHLLQSRPLMEAPDSYNGLPAFNSDPDLFVEGNKVYVLNRSVFKTILSSDKESAEYEIRIFLIEGLFEKGRFKYISTRLFKETTELMASPCLTKYHGKYIYMSLWTNCYNDGETFDGLRYLYAKDIHGLSAQDDWQTIKVDVTRWIPWHMSVFLYQERLYAVVACIERGRPHRCWQMLGSFSENLSELIIYPTPLTDYQSYRGAAYVDNDGQFVLYSTTVREKIEGGGSVDGREVIKAHIPFELLLRKLSDNK